MKYIFCLFLCENHHRIVSPDPRDLVVFFIDKCIYFCLVFVCVHAYECVGACILDTYAETRGGHECPLQVCASVRLANLSSFRILCLLLPNMGVTDIHRYDFFFNMGFQDLNPGPHDCTASGLTHGALYSGIVSISYIVGFKACGGRRRCYTLHLL